MARPKGAPTVSGNEYAVSLTSLPWRDDAVVVHHSQSPTGAQRAQVSAGTLRDAVAWVEKKPTADREAYTIHLPERRKPPLSFRWTEFAGLIAALALIEAPSD